MWTNFLQSFKRQILYAEESSGLRISIRVRRQDPLAYTFLAIWLSGWTIFGIKGIDTLLENTPSALPLWPLGWAFGEIVMVVVALFLIGGREVVTITPDFVKCRRQIFGIGFTREYFLHEVLNLRYQFPMHRRPGRLDFDYEGRTLRLVSDVSGAEAVELLGRIRQKMRDYRGGSRPFKMSEMIP
jgi:hypothetical protein